MEYYRRGGKIQKLFSHNSQLNPTLAPSTVIHDTSMAVLACVHGTWGKPKTIDFCSTCTPQPRRPKTVRKNVQRKTAYIWLKVC